MQTSLLLSPWMETRRMQARSCRPLFLLWSRWPFLSGTAATYTPMPLRLLANPRLTPQQHWQDVREIEMKIPSVEELRRWGAVVPHAAAGTAAAAAAAPAPLSAAHRAAGCVRSQPRADAFACEVTLHSDQQNLMGVFIKLVRNALSSSTTVTV